MKHFFLLPLIALLATPVLAANMAMPADTPSVYEVECASCHMAYPPGLLGDKSWQNMMGNLSKHFGTDASIDEKDQTVITSWLIKHAATRQKYRELAPDNRITKTTWFIRKHDELKASVWKRPSIKSPSNCAACHIDAAKGLFDEDNIRIPAK